MHRIQRPNKTVRIAAAAALLLLAAATSLSAITAEEVIREMEDNQVHETSRTEGKMIIEDRFGSKTVTFVSWAQGDEQSLIEFTSRQERGQKILRTEDELYLFFPDAAEVIRLQGAALRDSVLGSDFSYEDMTGEGGILDAYEVDLLGTETVAGRECYKVELTAKSRNVPYPKEIMWVDTELFVYRRVHKFSLSGKLLKEMRITDFVEKQGKTIPARFVMQDKLKRNSSTEFIIEELQLGIEIPDGTFSLQELRW
jgi:outer membrane lipoprotein-sorting protein